MFYFEEFGSASTSEKARSAEFIDKIRRKLTELSSKSAELGGSEAGEGEIEPLVKVEEK